MYALYTEGRYHRQMRVIAGTYRSRLLASPPGTATRPTSDRLRETLFNILATRVPGCRFVDLYAGTGAVGIEAISRGAEFVWFSENAVPALKTLRKNLETLKITSGFALEDRGTAALLQRLGKSPIDVVYLDPPYEAENEYTGTLSFLGSTTGRKLLAPGAIVVAEHASKSKFKLAERFGGLVRTREYKQGDASLSFYEAPADEVKTTTD
ncbi:16S rRNA (guanine(966)-N(2))-methyltransferase RsmD [Granulicella rosea]|uniref:16S rRNA (Guanine(966)-N(2))-methyltransferase RsmD n=1 Tax=Granulicella rosea TaxID=474952 RepID=A0A239KWI2_9BACT|nr:16S rRNA (guanine(966)-N(2))-methyltransferase RsmD [Granulicella rosea]